MSSRVSIAHRGISVIFVKTDIIGRFLDSLRSLEMTLKFSIFNSQFSIPYRQELILAVMSRTWFCILVSPEASACSTFFTEYKMVA